MKSLPIQCSPNIAFKKVRTLNPQWAGAPLDKKKSHPFAWFLEEDMESSLAVLFDE